MCDSVMKAMSDAYEYEEGEDWIDRALANGMGFKSEEEKKKYVADIGDPLKHPMFAGSYEDMKDHPLADSFRVLKEDGKSNYELASVNKDEGNMFIKKGTEKFYNLARDRYRYALVFVEKEEEILKKNIEEGVVAAGTESSEESWSKLMELKSQIYSNLALVEFTVQNHRQCIENCNAALIAYDKNAKAYFRKIKSLMALQKYDKATEICNTAISIAAGMSGAALDNFKDFPTLLNTCVKEQGKLLEQQVSLAKAKKASLDAKLKKYSEAYKIANQMRIKLAYGSVDVPSQLRTAFPYYEGNVPHFPVLLLYPQYNKFDVIEGVSDLNTMLAMYVADIFPEPEPDCDQYAEWDRDHEYYASNLDVFLYVYPHANAEDLSIVRSESEWLFSCNVLDEIKTGKCNYAHNLLSPKETKNDVDELTKFLNSMTVIDSDLKDNSAKQKAESMQQKNRRKFYESMIARTDNYMNGFGDGGRVIALNVHLGCTFLQILKTNGCILFGGLLSLVVLPRIRKVNGQIERNLALDQFIKKNKSCRISTRYLTPLGTVEKKRPVYEGEIRESIADEDDNDE